MTETRDKIVIESTTQGVDQSTDKLKGLANAYDGVAVASEKTEKSTVSIENKFASLERRFQTTAGQQAQFEKIQNQVNLAVKQNPELQDRANSVLAAAEVRYLGAGAAVKALASAHTGLDAQGQAALHTIRSVVEQLALGIPPTQALTGQLNHLTFAATGEGGLVGAFSQVGSFIGNIVTPMRLAAGGIIGVGAAAAYMALQWDDAQKVVERSLAGIGQRTGTTVADINAFSKANASATGLSITEARNVAIEFTKTGAITVAGLHGVGEAVHGFATLTGTDATDATKKLASAFSGDLAKGADELNKTYGFLDSATRKQIESLQLQGDRMGAVQVIIDRMAPSNIKAAESVGILTQAWTGFKNVISNIGNLPGQSDQDRLKALQAARDAAANTPAVGITPGGFLNTSAAFGGKAAEIKALDDQIKALKATIDSTKTDGIVGELTALSSAGDAVVKSTIPEIDQIKNLELSLKALRDARDTPGVSRTLGSDDAAITIRENQLAALKESQAEAARYAIEVQNISSSWGNVGQSVALQLQSMQNALPVAQAWTEAGKMKAQYEATYLDLLNKGKTAQEASAIASKQEELSKAAAVASAQKTVQASEDNLDKIRAQGTEMEGVVASSIAYRDAIQSGATATQAAAIAANTLAANIMQAAKSADQLAISEYNAKTAADLAATKGSVFTPRTMPQGQLNFSVNPLYPVSYRGGGRGQNLDVGGTPIRLLGQDSITPDSTAAPFVASGNYAAAIKAVESLQASSGGINRDGSPVTGGINVNDQISQVDQLTQLLNSQTSDKGTQVNNLQKELAWLNTLPETIARDQKIVSLQQSIDSLKNSTDGLNSTMGDLLSPYYTQDPRTSHIGFRSQGMATGGEVTVPGGYSANDNMMASIPVASGEIIAVRRPGQSSGGGTTVNNFNIHTVVGDRADKNEIGRTVYQAVQNANRQLRAASQ